MLRAYKFMKGARIKKSFDVSSYDTIVDNMKTFTINEFYWH